jgi:hypothetical protein
MKTLLSLGMAVLLSACAMQAGPRHVPAYDSDYPLGPLEARILNADGRINIWTSRPAYVAVFEIVPGQGVGLLYPAYSEERSYVHGGMQSLWITGSRSYYSYFLASQGASRDMPRYLYLIASETPLRLSRFVRSPGALRNSLGFNRFAAFNPYSVMEDLDALVVPTAANTQWTSDVFAIWPEQRYEGGLADFDWIRVRCQDGRIIEGPSYYVFSACARPDQRQAPPATANRPDTTSTGAGDSIRTPTRRRPEPEGRSAGEDEPVQRVAPDRAIIERMPVVERIREADSEPERARPEPAERIRAEPRIEREEPRVERPAPEPRIERVPEPRVERVPEPRVERPAPEPRVEHSPPPRMESPPPRVEVSRPEPSRPEPSRSEPPAGR